MKILSKVYFGLFVASLILGSVQFSYLHDHFEPSGLDFLSAFVLLAESVLLWVLTKKWIFPVCLFMSGFFYLTVFSRIDISEALGELGTLIGFCFFILGTFHIFDILGFISYCRSRKKRTVKPSSLEINERIGGAVATGLTSILCLAISFTVDWSGLVLVPVAFLLIILTLAQGISLFKDCRTKNNLKMDLKA